MEFSRGSVGFYWVQYSTDQPTAVFLDPEGPFGLVWGFFSKPLGRLNRHSKPVKGSKEDSQLLLSTDVDVLTLAGSLTCIVSGTSHCSDVAPPAPM